MTGSWEGPARVEETAVDLARAILASNFGDRHDAARLARLVLAEEGEGYEHCLRCGRGNCMWAAPSPLWNLVMRGNDINGEPLYGDLVCPVCFTQLAEALLGEQRWRLVPDDMPTADLIYITPSGRVWDDEAWLWRETNQ